MNRPSAEIAVASVSSSHEYGCSVLSPGNRPLICRRQVSRDNSTRPSFEISCKRTEGKLRIAHSLPVGVTAKMVSAHPDVLVPANHTSLPSGLQAKPSTLASVESTVWLPFISTKSTDPSSFPRIE